jgi:hypothetical protein
MFLFNASMQKSALEYRPFSKIKRSREYLQNPKKYYLNLSERFPAFGEGESRILQTV